MSERAPNTERRIRDERGMINFAVMAAARRARRDKEGGMKFRTKAGLATVMVAGVAMGLGGNLEDTTGTADLNEAGTHADIGLVDFQNKSVIETSVARFDETLSATKIKYEIESHPIDLIKDCEGNKQLKGEGTVRFQVPVDAITQNIADKKVNFTVDSSKLIAVAYWDGAGPEVRDFTVHDGKRNFNDSSGFCLSTLKAWTSAQKVINVDKIANLITGLDDSIEYDLRKKGLKLFTDSCAKELDAPNKEAIKLALAATVTKLGRAADMGKVTFTDVAMTWNVDEGTKKGSVKEGESGYKLKDGFKMDSVNCNIDATKLPTVGATPR